MGLEAVVDVQHKVESLSIKLLGVLLEIVNTLVALRTVLISAVVASALLVTACTDVAVIKDVGKREVDAHGVMSNGYLLTYAGIQHETAIASALFRYGSVIGNLQTCNGVGGNIGDAIFIFRIQTPECLTVTQTRAVREVNTVVIVTYE